MSINNSIKQIIAPTVPMDAVYYYTEEKELERVPVMFLALWDDVNDVNSSEITPCSIDDSGFVAECSDAMNFIGYEYCGIKKTWETEIAECIKRENEWKNNNPRKGE